MFKNRKIHSGSKEHVTKYFILVETEKNFCHEKLTLNFFSNEKLHKMVFTILFVLTKRGLMISIFLVIYVRNRLRRDDSDIKRIKSSLVVLF